MSGTGQFRSVRNGAWTGSPSSVAKEHLGDRLAAFVDGELCDDSRERVLSHLATCDLCKVEAEEQRRLKNAVADALPPALSDGLLARLQGLPGLDGDDPGDPGGAVRGAFGRGGLGGDVFGSRGGGRSYLAPAGEELGGFPIHDINRSASRTRRLAFVAAGAFSLAALALGGALPLDAAFEGGGLPEPAPGTASTPLSLNQVSDPGSAGARAGSVPAAVSGRLLAPQGSPDSVRGARVQDAPRNPSPSALPAAGLLPTVPGPPAPPVRPGDTAALTARSVAPAPLPLLSGIEHSLPLSAAPLPGGHTR